MDTEKKVVKKRRVDDARDLPGLGSECTSDDPQAMARRIERLEFLVLELQSEPEPEPEPESGPEPGDSEEE